MSQDDRARFRKLRTEISKALEADDTEFAHGALDRMGHFVGEIVKSSDVRPITQLRAWVDRTIAAIQGLEPSDLSSEVAMALRSQSQVLHGAIGEIRAEAVAHSIEREHEVVRDRVLRLLRGAPQPLRPKHIGDELGCDPSQVSRALNELLGERVIANAAAPPDSRDRRGRWYTHNDDDAETSVQPPLGPLSTAGVSKLRSATLTEGDIPTQWYNIIPDLPAPPPPVLHPGTMEPVGPDDLAPLFPMALILQEVSQDSYIDIPGEVLDIYRLWRPSPLHRARRLEKLLDTPAKIFYKYEGGSPVGSHKPNTSVPQAFYNAQEGARKLTTETGAGQWGSALAFACSLFGLDCEVWMVAASFDQKPYRKTMMEVWGATVHSSPSTATAAGRKIRDMDPNSPGSLGIAISEAVEVAAQSDDVKYSLGSVLNHVLMHQTIIGEEALRQFAKIDETPDVLVGCTGGGSNFGGLSFPFIREKLAGNINPTIRCVEPAACPSLTRGEYRYDFGDTLGMTPLIKMHTLGHDFVPDPIHAGGLRYHGMSPLVSHLYELGMVEAEAIHQNECFSAAMQFARTEGIVPAPEPAHALAATVREAERCKESGEEKVILTAMCGHGHFDLAAYEAYLAGDLVDYEYPEAKVAAAMANVPVVAGV